MKVVDLRPGNFEKACGFFSLFIIHFFTIVLGGKYRELPFTPWNYIYHISSCGRSTEDLCANFGK